MNMVDIDTGYVEIEGLSPDDPSANMLNDTNPGALITRFSVERELMPFLTEQEGRPVYKTFVYVERKWNLGNSVIYRRINDTVEFDATSQRWKIVRLNPGVVQGPNGPVSVSDIKKNPEEWNAFARGASQDDIGTPVELLFKNDPARAEQYKLFHIRTIESLAALSDGNIDQLPMGARADRDRAKAALERMKPSAAHAEFHNRLEEKDRQFEKAQKQNELMQKQIEELTAKLSSLLADDVESLKAEPKRRGRSKNETGTGNTETLQG